ncbi:MAG TPA: hypothetical protein VJT31_17775 [Rugosimonospora sp.]|nr:hypothetical protein [Rugosimonospora sp.]
MPSEACTVPTASNGPPVRPVTPSSCVPNAPEMLGLATTVHAVPPLR